MNLWWREAYMDYKQSVMSGIDDVFQNMASGATQAPLSRNIVITSSEIYAQKRSKYLQRLTTEKNTFNSAIKEIQKKKTKRITAEKERNLARQKRREQGVHSVKLITYWCFIIAAIAINLVFANSAMKDAFADDVGSGLGLPWATLWPAWIVIAVTLLLTAILSRRLVGDDGSSGVVAMILEVLSILICAIVLSGWGFLVGLIRCAIGYAVPVGICGLIGLVICTNAEKK